MVYVTGAVPVRCVFEEQLTARSKENPDEQSTGQPLQSKSSQAPSAPVLSQYITRITMDLMETLDPAKWRKADSGQKKDYHEYQVMRQHKQLGPTTYRYLIQPDMDSEPQGVVIEFTLKDKDPLKDIGTAELRLKDDKITGIDLDGDCMELI